MPDPAQVDTVAPDTNRLGDDTMLRTSQRNGFHSGDDSADESTTLTRSSGLGSTPGSQCSPLDLPTISGHHPRSPGFVCSVLRFLSSCLLTHEEPCLIVLLSDLLCLTALLHCYASISRSLPTFLSPNGPSLHARRSSFCLLAFTSLRITWAMPPVVPLWKDAHRSGRFAEMTHGQPFLEQFWLPTRFSTLCQHCMPQHMRGHRCYPCLLRQAAKQGVHSCIGHRLTCSFSAPCHEEAVPFDFCGMDVSHRSDHLINQVC